MKELKNERMKEGMPLPLILSYINFYFFDFFETSASNFL